MVAWAFKKNQDQEEKSFVGVMLQSHSEKVRKKVLFWKKFPNKTRTKPEQNPNQIRSDFAEMTLHNVAFCPATIAKKEPTLY